MSHFTVSPYFCCLSLKYIILGSFLLIPSRLHDTHNDMVNNKKVIICSLAEWIEAVEVFGVAEAADEAAASFLSDCRLSLE